MFLVWLTECPLVRVLNRIQRGLLCHPGSVSASIQDPRLPSLTPSEVEVESKVETLPFRVSSPQHAHVLTPLALELEASLVIIFN